MNDELKAIAYSALVGAFAGLAATGGAYAALVIRNKLAVRKALKAQAQSAE